MIVRGSASSSRTPKVLESAGEDAFREALLEGRSIDEAFGAAFQANLAAAGGPVTMLHFLAADLFVQGFDPGLRGSALIRDVIDEARIENIVAEGTISIFGTIINGTTGDDNPVGSLGDNVNTQFFCYSGSTFGGTDNTDGRGGTDEAFVQNISDFLSIGTFGTGAGPRN